MPPVEFHFRYFHVSGMFTKLHLLYTYHGSFSPGQTWENGEALFCDPVAYYTVFLCLKKSEVEIKKIYVHIGLRLYIY